MDKRKQITSFLLFFFLVLFPFGQIFRILLPFGITFQPLDLVSLASLFLLTKDDLKNKNFLYLIIFLGFGLLLSLAIFNVREVIPGSLYWLRLLGYFAFYLNLNKIFKTDKNKKLIINALILVLGVTAVFGWLQYILLPDFRSFKVLGWDDHLYRLIGTFLDPGFTGIIFVLGFLLIFGIYMKTKKKILLLTSLIMVASIAFTYSRASYLAFIISGFVLSFLLKRMKLFLIVLATFFVIVIFLPRPASSGVELERKFSIDLRLENYKKGLAIFKKSPIFGIGFNNLCIYKIKYEDEDVNSHACGGLDSSIIYILATTGIVGLIIFIQIATQLIQRIDLQNKLNQVFFASLLAVLIHSQFVNSLFYPWTLGCLAILGALSKKQN